METVVGVIIGSFFFKPQTKHTGSVLSTLVFLLGQNSNSISFIFFFKSYINLDLKSDQYVCMELDQCVVLKSSANRKHSKFTFHSTFQQK